MTIKKLPSTVFAPNRLIATVNKLIVAVEALEERANPGKWYYPPDFMQNNHCEVQPNE